MSFVFTDFLNVSTLIRGLTLKVSSYSNYQESQNQTWHCTIPWGMEGLQRFNQTLGSDVLTCALWLNRLRIYGPNASCYREPGKFNQQEISVTHHVVLRNCVYILFFILQWNMRFSYWLEYGLQFMWWCTIRFSVVLASVVRLPCTFMLGLVSMCG